MQSVTERDLVIEGTAAQLADHRGHTSPSAADGTVTLAFTRQSNDVFMS